MFLWQECIPVWCALPACWPYPLVLRGCQPGAVCRRGLWGCLPREGLHRGPPDQRQTNPSRGQYPWHTFVKILPCPKLRLLMVKMQCKQHNSDDIPDVISSFLSAHACCACVISRIKDIQEENSMASHTQLQLLKTISYRKFNSVFKHKLRKGNKMAKITI